MHKQRVYCGLRLRVRGCMLVLGKVREEVSERPDQQIIIEFVEGRLTLALGGRFWRKEKRLFSDYDENTGL
jgi:hypothetical protein